MVKNMYIYKTSKSESIEGIIFLFSLFSNSTYLGHTIVWQSHLPVSHSQVQYDSNIYLKLKEKKQWFLICLTFWSEWVKQISSVTGTIYVSAGFSCNSNYFPVLGCGCYRLTTSNTQGWKSLGHCFSHGGHPVDIGSQTENDVIMDHLKNWQIQTGTKQFLNML